MFSEPLITGNNALIMQTWGELVQAGAAICGIPILIYGIYLTLNSLKLARESANAAIQAVSIGMRQAEAAENAANLSIKQMALSVAAQDKATQPMLVLELNLDSTIGTIQNSGLGPAHDINVRYCINEHPIFCATDVLGVGATTSIKMDKSSLEQYGLVIDYKSMLGRGHRVTYMLQDHYFSFKETHSSSPAEFDKLWDIQFNPAVAEE